MKVDKKTVVDMQEEKKITNAHIFIIIMCTLVIAIFIAFTSFVLINKKNENTFKNVYLLGVDISNQSYSQIESFLNDLNSKNYKINLYQNEEKIYELTAQSFGYKIDVEKTLDSIFEFGRSNNDFKNTNDILNAYFNKVEFEPCFEYDNKKLKEVFVNIDLLLKDKVEDDTFFVEGDTLIIQKGKAGNYINNDDEIRKVLSNFKSQYVNSEISKDITLNIQTRDSNSINVSEIAKKVKKEPVNAFVDESVSPIKIIKEQTGYYFDENDLSDFLNKEENKNAERLEYKLNVVEPSVKILDLNTKIFRNLLASYTTYFDASVDYKKTNMTKAVESLNEKIIMPGEIFSFNDAIGEVSYAAGYIDGKIYVGNTTALEVGGGICQSVSTLYNLVLKANLKIIERHQHGMGVYYVPPSADATVYAPNIDFKFQNTRNYPIKLVTSCNNGVINMSVYGIYEEVEYDIEVVGEYLSQTPFSTKYIYDDTLKEGEQEIITYGMNGYTSQSYVIKSLNGIQVSKEPLTYDVYSPQEQVIKIGTEK